jgi:hypothetical protein
MPQSTQFSTTVQYQSTSLSDRARDRDTHRERVCVYMHESHTINMLSYENQMHVGSTSSRNGRIQTNSVKNGRPFCLIRDQANQLASAHITRPIEREHKPSVARHNRILCLPDRKEYDKYFVYHFAWRVAWQSTPVIQHHMYAPHTHVQARQNQSMQDWRFWRCKVNHNTCARESKKLSIN